MTHHTAQAGDDGRHHPDDDVALGDLPRERPRLGGVLVDKSVEDELQRPVAVEQQRRAERCH